MSTVPPPTSLPGNLQVVILAMGFCLAPVLITGRVVEGALLGAGLFLLYRIGIVRMVISRHHRRGIVLSRDGRHEEALEAFQRSEDFWAVHPGLDRHRGWLLGSATPWPFGTLALYNQAYCLSHLGRDAEAIAVLDEVIARQPDMGIARQLQNALREQMLDPEDDPGPWASDLAGLGGEG